MKAPKFMAKEMMNGKGISVNAHNHPMHKGPHHDMYMHADNRDVSVPPTNLRGENELGNKSHLDSLKGAPHGADVAGHDGKMHW